MSESQSMTLRAATAADQPTIEAIIKEAGINPLGLKWARFVLAEDQGKVVGTGQIKPHGDGSRELASIAVLPAYQKQGVARLIIEHLLTQESGTIYLMCQSRLRPFYEKFGFHVVPLNEMPPYFRRIKRMAGVVMGVMAVFWRNAPRLAVMRRASQP